MDIAQNSSTNGASAGEYADVAPEHQTYGGSGTATMYANDFFDYECLDDDTSPGRAVTQARPLETVRGSTAVGRPRQTKRFSPDDMPARHAVRYFSQRHTDTFSQLFVVSVVEVCVFGFEALT
jgi:hypothetical protein